MSRTPIPFPSKSLDFKYYKHVGIIGYTKEMLDFYKDSQSGALEKIEGIDTMRFIDYGKRLDLVYVPNCNSLSVDTEMDIKRIREKFNNIIEGGRIPCFAKDSCLGNTDAMVVAV